MTGAALGCAGVAELLEGHRRGELEPDAVGRVEAHLARCSACRSVRERDDILAAILHRLPVTPAPPALRRRIEATAGRRRWLGSWLGRPWVGAAVAAGLVAVALAPWLDIRGTPAPDPIENLVLSGVAEYERIRLQLPGGSAEVTDPARAFAAVRALTDVQLPPAFAGDRDYRLVAVRPTILADRRAAAAVLAYEGRPVCAYFVLPGQDLPMPDARRVQIEQYRPYGRRVRGVTVIYWKQAALAFLMVTDLDEERSRQMFLRVRKAL